MHLTREIIDRWAESLRANRPRIGPPGGLTRLVRLEEGDSIIAVSNPQILRDAAHDIEGPAIVELVVYRDGGWAAREQVFETPESIALAASIEAHRRPRLTALPTTRRDPI